MFTLFTRDPPGVAALVQLEHVHGLGVGGAGQEGAARGEGQREDGGRALDAAPQLVQLRPVPGPIRAQYRGSPPIPAHLVSNTLMTVPLVLAVATLVLVRDSWSAASWPSCAGITTRHASVSASNTCHRGQ